MYFLLNRMWLFLKPLIYYNLSIQYRVDAVLYVNIFSKCSYLQKFINSLFYFGGEFEDVLLDIIKGIEGGILNQGC